MSYRRVLEGYTPPLDVQWLAYRVEEATNPDNVSAVTIDGPTLLSPVITDVSDPPTYTFTVNATLAEGWYRVVWLDPDTSSSQATTWYEYRAIPAYAPSVGDIASILRARAIEPGGHPVSSFTDQTNPTAYRVQELIALYTPVLFARLGRMDNLGCANAADLRSAARTLAAQRVAIEVEASYWPEELGDQANVDVRRQMLDADVTALVASMDACRASGDDGTDGGESTSRFDPAWRFAAYRPMRF